MGAAAAEVGTAASAEMATAATAMSAATLREAWRRQRETNATAAAALKTFRLFMIKTPFPGKQTP